MRSEPTTGRVRRSQAERRATTRAALLEATLEVLADRGYSGLTTAEIAQRANVTRGAQAHHFTNKAEMVTEAVRHLTAKLAEDQTAVASSRVGGTGDIVRLLDDLWALHHGAAFAAAIELWLAARTDADLRAALGSLERDFHGAAHVLVARALPEVADSRETAQLLSTTLATMRGLALLTFVHDDVTKEWHAARRQMAAAWTGLAPGSFK